jgi:hypothetical protein
MSQNVKVALISTIVSQLRMGRTSQTLGNAVTYLDVVLFYKPEGRKFDSRCGTWNVRLT